MFAFCFTQSLWSVSTHLSNRTRSIHPACKDLRWSLWIIFFRRFAIFYVLIFFELTYVYVFLYDFAKINYNWLYIIWFLHCWLVLVDFISQLSNLSTLDLFLSLLQRVGIFNRHLFHYCFEIVRILLKCFLVFYSNFQEVVWMLFWSRFREQNSRRISDRRVVCVWKIAKFTSNLCV